MYKYIIDNNIKISLILEDDCILAESFKMKLNKIINQLPEDFDTCFLGDSFGWTVNNFKFGFFGSFNKNVISSDINVYKMPCAHTADAYIISYNGATNLYNEIDRKRLV